jgi:hypothetical protein
MLKERFRGRPLPHLWQCPFRHRQQPLRVLAGLEQTLTRPFASMPMENRGSMKCAVAFAASRLARCVNEPEGFPGLLTQRTPSFEGVRS